MLRENKIWKNNISFGDAYQNIAVCEALRIAFNRHGYVKLPNLLPRNAITILRNEVLNLAAIGRARDFIMHGFETPRIMTTVGGKQIIEHSILLRRFYDDPRLRQILSRIVGSTIFDCLDQNEWGVSTSLKGVGQTHGFHLDDPPIALIIILEAPPAEHGGVLEVINDWHKTALVFGSNPVENIMPLVGQLRELGMVQTKEHATGEAYLLRADQCLHAVAPLRSTEATRSILNFAFELEPNCERTSPTAMALFE